MSRLILICAALFYNANATALTLTEELAKFDIHIDGIEFFSKCTIQIRKGNALTFYKLISNAQNGQSIEVEIIYPLEKGHAQQYASTKDKIIENAFEPQPTPYPGEISNTSVCPKKFHPIKITISNPYSLGPALIARANSRFLWGNCSKSEPAKTGVQAFYYMHKNSQLLKLNIFFNENEFNKKKASAILAGLKLSK